MTHLSAKIAAAMTLLFVTGCGDNAEHSRTQSSSDLTTEHSTSSYTVNEPPETVQRTSDRYEGIVTCTPGCTLQNDDMGKPIVPDWCEAWSPVSPTCVRLNDKTYCVGIWEGAKRSVNEISDHGTIFHLDENPSGRRARAQKDSVYFACTRINRAKFSDGNGKNDMMPDFPGAPSSVSCSPGCIFDTQDASRQFLTQPAWCLRAKNAGCSSNLAASCLEPKPLNLCYRIKPIDEK